MVPLFKGEISRKNGDRILPYSALRFILCSIDRKKSW